MHKVNKKVLLRARKRHTARRVASTRDAVPVGGTPPSWDLTWMGEVPPCPNLGRGHLPFRPKKEVPPVLTWEGVPLYWPGKGYSHPHLGRGYPLSWPGKWYPCPELGEVSQSIPGKGVPPSKPGKGVPLSWPGKGVPPVLTWEGGTPSRPGKGIPPIGKDGVPPLGRMGYPCQEGTTPSQWEGWGYPPSLARWAYPSPCRCEQTDTCENSIFPHPSDAGGNETNFS